MADDPCPDAPVFRFGTTSSYMAAAAIVLISVPVCLVPWHVLQVHAQPDFRLTSTTITTINTMEIIRVIDAIPIAN